jgi:hypothetical protein
VRKFAWGLLGSKRKEDADDAEMQNPFWNSKPGGSLFDLKKSVFYDF